jgi:GT2 family glycosyltransferase
VVVLNYNGVGFLQACFDSLLKLDYPADRLELMCVDNHSSDGSVEFMRSRFPGVRVVETGANLVFAGGNHAGARAATGEFVAFLNNDTHVPPDWLSTLIRPCLDQPDVVCSGSRIVSWDGTLLEFGGSSLNWAGFGYQEGYGRRHSAGAKPGQPPREVLFACGGAMAIRRDVFLETGGFDKDFQIYYEDSDLGWRLWVLGYRVLFVPDSTVYHRHHGTMAAVADWKRRVLFERNTLFSVVKNYEDENLARVLPVALMLLAKRALHMSGAEVAQYRFAPEAPDAPTHRQRRRGLSRVQHYGRQALRVLRDDGVGALASRGLQVVWRARGDGDPVYPPREIVRPPATDPDFEQVPRAALAHLVAADDLIRYWPRLMEKRRWIQARRRRSDAEIWRLFGRPLDTNFFEGDYVAAQAMLLHASGIDRIAGRVRRPGR